VTRLAIVASFALAATAHARIAAAQSSDPRQTAEYLQRTALISALDVATRYVESPVCSEANKPPCSDPSIIHEIINTAEMASKAMKVVHALSGDAGPAGITAETHALAVNIAVETADKILNNLVSLIPEQQALVLKMTTYDGAVSPVGAVAGMR
jgi:hypothetical protein